MSYEDYASETRLLKKESSLRDGPQRRHSEDARLALFIDNKPYYFDTMYLGAVVINQIYGGGQSKQNKTDQHYGLFYYDNACFKTNIQT